MPIKTGSFIDGNNNPADKRDGGESVASTNTSGPGIVEERSSEPEIIAGFEAYEPDTARVDSGARRTKRGGIDRRTKAGRAAGSEGSKVSETVNFDLTTILLSIHQMGAALLNVEELGIEESEAKQLADGIKEVQKYYPVMAVDPKKLVLINMGAIMVGVYGTRIGAYRARRAKERQKNKLSSIDRSGEVPEVTPLNEPKQKHNGRAMNQMTPSELWFQPAE